MKKPSKDPIDIRKPVLQLCNSLALLTRGKRPASAVCVGCDASFLLSYASAPGSGTPNEEHLIAKYRNGKTWQCRRATRAFSVVDCNCLSNNDGGGGKAFANFLGRQRLPSRSHLLSHPSAY